jgi:hypothetical protein
MQLENQAFDLIGWYLDHLEQRARDPSTGCCIEQHVLVGCSQSRVLVPAEGPGISDDDPIYDDLPDLVPLSDLEDLDYDYVSDDDCEVTTTQEEHLEEDSSEEELVAQLYEVLLNCQPFPGDGPPADPTYRGGDGRFVISQRRDGLLEIYDRVQGFETHISPTYLGQEGFSAGRWFAE